MSKAFDEMNREDDMPTWFQNQMDGVQMRCQQLDSLAKNDEAQARAYQERIDGFERQYFEKYSQQAAQVSTLNPEGVYQSMRVSQNISDTLGSS